MVIDRGADPRTGKRLREWHSGFRTKTEAQRARTKLLGELDAGTYLDPSEQTVVHYLREVWLPARRPTNPGGARGPAVRSASRPTDAAGPSRGLHRPYVGRVRLQNVTIDTLDSLYDELETSGGRHGQGLQPQTVLHVHRTLHKAFKDAMRRGTLSTNPGTAGDPPRRTHAGDWRTGASEMQGHVSAYDTANGRKWRAIVDLGRQPCRRCLECGARTFDVNATGCPRRRCHGDLAAPALERRQLSSKGHATKRAAQAAARELIGDVEQRGYTAPRNTDLAGYLRDWLGGLALKPTTIADYTQSAEVYVIPRVGHVSLQRVTPELLDRLYRDLERAGSKRGTPLSPKSVRNVHIMLHKALGDATARGHIGRNPVSLANPLSAKAARSKAAQQCWTREQVRVFLESVADHRLYGLWRLLAATGLRRAEALGLRWSDLDGSTLAVAERTVTTAAGKVVWQDDGKSAKAARRIALDATTLQALRVHRQRQLEEHMAVGPAWSSDPRDEGLMFTLEDGRAIRPDSCWRTFSRLAKAAGLPHKGGLHVLLRHSYATAALRAGVSPEIVSARVGHAHVATTLSIYAHVTEADDQDAADATAAYLDG